MAYMYMLTTETCQETMLFIGVLENGFLPVANYTSSILFYCVSHLKKEGRSLLVNIII